MTTLRVIEEISTAIGVDMTTASELYTERLYEIGEAEAFLKGLAWLKARGYVLTGHDAELVRESLKLDAANPYGCCKDRMPYQNILPGKCGL